MSRAATVAAISALPLAGAQGQGSQEPPDDDEDSFDFGEDERSALDQAHLEQLVKMPPAPREDPYGPRPEGTPALTLGQILPLSAQNPRRAQGRAKIEQMHALLAMARFAWIPSIKVSAALSPGVNIACDDIPLATQDPNQPLTFQYCRARSDANLDLNRVGDYLKDLNNAGIALRIEGDLLIPITTFGKGLAYRDAARAGVALAGLDALRVAQQNTLETQQAYLTVQLAQSSLMILEEAWGILKRHTQRLKTSSDADPADLPRLELAQVEVAQRSVQARQLEAGGLAALWALTGDAAPPYFGIAPEPLKLWKMEAGPATREYFRALALLNRPEALMAKAQLRLRRAQEKVAKRMFLPDLGVLVGFRMSYANKADQPRERYYDNRANFSAIWAGLGVRWEFVPSVRIFGLQKARAQTDEAAAQRAGARQWVLLEVDRAFDDVRTARQAVTLTEMAIVRARRLIALQEAKATLGEADMQELSRALKRWAELEFQRLASISRHNSAMAKLSRAVGRPVGGPAQ